MTEESYLGSALHNATIARSIFEQELHKLQDSINEFVSSGSSELNETLVKSINYSKERKKKTIGGI